MRTKVNDKNMPKVLVLLASYNGKRWLAEQLESILAQEAVSICIHIADDASTDDTEQFIRSAYGKDDRIVYRRWDTPSGSAGANFRRLYCNSDLSGFDFVALADQDDIWDTKKMASAVFAMSKTGATGYSCSVTSFWPDGRRQVLSQAPTQRAADFLFEGAGQGCTFVLRQDLFEKVKQFCIAHEAEVAMLHYHDWLLYLLARAWGGAWYFDQTSYMQYRQHGGNEIGSRGSVSAVTKRLSLITTGWYKNQVTAAVKIFKLADGVSPEVSYLDKQLSRRDSLARRLCIFRFVLVNGRRKAGERLIVAASAAAGLI